MKSENEEIDGDGDNLGRTISPYEREFFVVVVLLSTHMDRNLEKQRQELRVFPIRYLKT